MSVKRNGFSLIEVIVAVAILSVASVAILRHFSQSLYLIGHASHSTRFGDQLKFNFHEAVRAYASDPSDEMTYETDEYVFKFTFADPTFPEAEDYAVIPGIALKEITATVLQKPDNQKIFSQVTYYVLPVKQN